MSQAGHFSILFISPFLLLILWAVVFLGFRKQTKVSPDDNNSTQEG